MRLPPPREFLIRLVQAEERTHQRATHVASRFELASSGVILLELVCQTRIALDELEAFAELRSIPVHGVMSWLGSCVAALVHWLGALWSHPTPKVYASIASSTLRDVEIAARLRLAALRVADHALADWCAHWMKERLGLIERLTVSLGVADTHRFARLSGKPFEAQR